MKTKSRLKANLSSAFAMTLFILAAAYGIYCVETAMLSVNLPITILFLIILLFILCYQYNKLKDENRLWEEGYFHLDILFHKAFKALQNHGGDKDLEETMEKVKNSNTDMLVKMSVRNALGLPYKEES